MPPKQAGGREAPARPISPLPPVRARGKGGRCERPRPDRTRPSLPLSLELRNVDQDPRPRAFFRSSHFVREDSIDRLSLLVHSTIDPAYSLASLRPRTSWNTNQSVEAQWPVLQ